MSRIEFTMKPNHRDVMKAAHAKVWIIPWVRFFLILSIAAFFPSLVLLYYGFDSQKEFYGGMVFLSCLAMGLPFLVIRLIDEKHYRSAKPRYEDCLFYMDEKGIGWESNVLKVEMSWIKISRVIDTNRFYFIKFSNGGYLTIFKRLLPSDTVEQIHNMFIHSNKIKTQTAVKTKESRP